MMGRELDATAVDGLLDGGRGGLALSTGTLGKGGNGGAGGIGSSADGKGGTGGAGGVP